MARKSIKAKKTPATKVPGRKRGRPARGGAGLGRIIAAEQKRLHKSRQNALARKAQIDGEIASIDRELSAMTAFLSAKLGGIAGRVSFSGKQRRGQKRQMILDLIKSVPEGLTRGEIIEKLGAVEKSAQQSVSNALANLFKAKALSRTGRKYRAS